MRSAITLDKVDLLCADIVKAKPTGNDHGLIRYLDTVYLYGFCLDNCVYLITQWH